MSCWTSAMLIRYRKATRSEQFGAAMLSIRDKVQFGCCAVVATRDAMFDMMRVFEVRAGDHFDAIHVFRETAEAEIWLASQKTGAGSGPVTGARGRSEC